MPYVGTQPTTGIFTELDALTASATADYALTLNGAAYNPATVNNLLVSINGVIQAGSTMSLSGSTLTVGATLSSSDVIDFVRVFGSVGTVSTPTDGSVTTAKLGNSAVTKAKIGTTELDLATIKDSTGTNTAITIDSSGSVSMPNSFYHNLWRLTASHSVTTSLTDVTAWADADGVDNYKRIGASWTVSSGVFTPPVTGLWEICFHYSVYSQNSSRYYKPSLAISTDGGSSFSSPDTFDQVYSSGGSNWYTMGTVNDYHNITSTSNFRIKVQTLADAALTLRGGGSLQSGTKLLFKRVADAVT